jgi:hypothetical protein
MFQRVTTINLRVLVLLVFAAVFLLAGLIFGSGSNIGSAGTAIAAPTPDKAAYAGYKGVMVGLSVDEARKKLGNPKDKSDTQDFFVFSDNESAQVYYDATKNVSLVSVSFVGKVDGIPSPKEVFGEDVVPKGDGSVFKMVRYPKAGYSISYNRTAGDDPIVTITIQKVK